MGAANSLTREQYFAGEGFEPATFQLHIYFPNRYTTTALQGPWHFALHALRSIINIEPINFWASQYAVH